MKNAETILRTLDERLEEPVRLVIYGRAALALGFQPAPAAAELSMDVDVILPLDQSAALETAPGFWEALAATNLELEPQGLYLTHVFEETQVILRPDWLDHLVPIRLSGLAKLQLARPAAIDLLLTKMMRGADPQDMADADFLIRQAGLQVDEVAAAIGEARVPDVPEIHALFLEAQAALSARDPF